MATLIMLNNFLHDFGAAGWIFGTVILWSALRDEEYEGDARRLFVRIVRSALLLMRLCLLGIVVCGTVRAIAYRQYEWSDAAGDGQVMVLVVKHILLTGVFAAGVFQYIKARGRARELSNEGTQ
jgi:putative copper export protein